MVVLTHPRYEARDVLGAGAQGVVLRVVDREAPARALVAKVWRARAQDERGLAAEFALLARLRIPGLVRAHDLGRDERTGAPFLVEDFADGPEAAPWVAQVAGAQANARLLAVMADVATALSGLHDAGFAHGDLKPAHVRVVERESDRGTHAVLLDLGAAVSRARSGGETVAFTPAYAAPEVRAGGRTGSASDLYGLGALSWALATGRPPPEAGGRPPVRDLAPWVQPAIAELIEALLAPHPSDRPADALAVVGRLGVAGCDAGIPARWAPPPVGRERELEALLGPSRTGVRYVVGPSGAGKSHVLRELVTRALLSGRDVRLVVFPADVHLASRLVAYFRGAEHAWPFVSGAGRPGGLVVLDDLHLAPRELVEALDAWRCRPREGARPEILAGTRDAPEGAETLAFAPLGEAPFAELCRALGIEDDVAIAEAARASQHSPGWLVASQGRVPLTRDMALERIRGLSPQATEALATMALCGGAAPETLLCDRRAVAELMQASLATRRLSDGATSYALTAPALAGELAAALVTFEIADGAAASLLAASESDASALLGVAQGPVPPARRDELLARASARARVQGLRSEEMDALFALAADPARRDATLLCRLERLTRDVGAAATHPQVLAWLDEAAQRDATVRPLALRKRAERAARGGDAAAARALALEARDAARAIDDPVAEALSIATMGHIALLRADWAEAEVHLADARARLASHDVADVDEIARIDHNSGVVALYRGRVDDAIQAFERAIARKRTLGDRAGLRSCLLNLGIALAKVDAHDEAERALDEAIALTRSLGQKAGRAWCLAARADVEVRRRRAGEAERWIAEAEALADAAPAVVRADLLLLRAQVALLQGDGWRALEVLARIEPGARAEQALVDTRARVLEAEAHLATLPADRRLSARIAVDAVRRARRAGLPEAEGLALAALRAARGRGGGLSAKGGYPSGVGDSQQRDDDASWPWLAELAAGRGTDESALALARLVASTSGAERAFVAAAGAGGRVTRAWGVDLDGIPLASPEQRLDAETVRAVLARDGAVYQSDIETPGGRGSRIAVASPPGDGVTRALVVAEHRFQSRRFDAVLEVDTRRWATLAGVLVRLASGPEPSRLDAPVQVPREHVRSEPLEPFSIPAALTTASPRVESRRIFPSILGDSPTLRRALARLDAAIDGDLPVLLVGDTGSGKELFARALHEHGARARGPFVAINCGAISDALLEAELFGHVRGSFTGAERTRPGLFASAEGGTLLLDEIGELPLPRQATLLRALETRRYRPVGGDGERAFDVRIVAATNRDLEHAVTGGAFRRDLLYRLNVVTIVVPSLRDRLEDIATLARAFLDNASSSAALAPDALAALEAYAWPGNVRELQHVMQRLAATGLAEVRLEHLPRALRGAAPRKGIASQARVSRPSATSLDERAEVERALTRSAGNISRAAIALGLTRQGLKKRMARLGLRVAAGGSRGDP